MKFDKDFKEAIVNLPSKEKDKLILRLLKKDVTLANRLFFELVSTKTIDEYRLEMEEQIQTKVERFSTDIYSIGYLNMDVRYLSGEISEYVRITKDKYGETSLNLLLLKEVLRYNVRFIEQYKPFSKARKLIVALIARAFKILMGINKLNDDYFIDFVDDLKEVGELFSTSPTCVALAIHHGLDINWFLSEHIPENIEEIHKDLRQRGYLK